MTGKTCFPGHDNFTMSWRDLVMTEDDKAVELSHLVDFCGMMALMAVYFMMYAGPPGLVCRIMDMTDRAGFGIGLEIIVDLVSCIEGPQ
jgi:hypothetical protein